MKSKIERIVSFAPINATHWMERPNSTPSYAFLRGNVFVMLDFSLYFNSSWEATSLDILRNQLKHKPMMDCVKYFHGEAPSMFMDGWSIYLDDGVYSYKAGTSFPGFVCSVPDFRTFVKDMTYKKGITPFKENQKLKPVEVSGMIGRTLVVEVEMKAGEVSDLSGFTPLDFTPIGEITNLPPNEVKEKPFQFETNEPVIKYELLDMPSGDIAKLMIDGETLYNIDGSRLFKWNGRQFVLNESGQVIRINGKFYRKVETVFRLDGELFDFLDTCKHLNGMTTVFNSFLPRNEFGEKIKPEVRAEFIKMCHMVASKTTNQSC